jgi:hypothetical protein
LRAMGDDDRRLFDALSDGEDHWGYLPNLVLRSLVVFLTKNARGIFAVDFQL